MATEPGAVPMADATVSEEEMARADLAEFEDRLDRLEATVDENTRRIQAHATLGWVLFILWLTGIVVGTIAVLRLM